MNRQLKQAVRLLKELRPQNPYVQNKLSVVIKLLTLPRKRPLNPPKLPKLLQSTKPQRATVYRQSTKEIRAVCMERADGRCELGVACLSADATLQMHHLEQGSGKRRQAQAISNCIIACLPCHRAYHHDPETFRFAVEEWAKAFGYPVPSRFRKGNAAPAAPKAISIPSIEHKQRGKE